jgi:asparagine N-glycosylation enzyme membrane subunit Stt3
MGATRQGQGRDTKKCTIEAALRKYLLTRAQAWEQRERDLKRWGWSILTGLLVSYLAVLWTAWFFSLPLEHPFVAGLFWGLFCVILIADSHFRL